MGLRNLAISLLALNCFICVSQDDNDFIQKFPEKITVRVGLQNTSNSFIITDTDNGNRSKLEPNKKTYLGASVLFRSLEVDFGFSPNFISDNKDNRGSRLLTLNFRMFWKQWMQTLDLYSQKGFSLSSANSREVFPDVKSLKIGGTTAYIFNENFSFRAIGFQNKWQKKSAGSFIPRFTFYYTKYDLGDTGFQNDSRSYDLAIGPGYFYNWVLDKNFILSAGSTVGMGINFTDNENDTFTSALYEAIIRSAIGYNSERFFAGINVNILFLEHNSNRYTRLDDKISFLEFYMGYRFNAPKKWVDKADQFNRKFGF